MEIFARSRVQKRVEEGTMFCPSLLLSQYFYKRNYVRCSTFMILNMSSAPFTPRTRKRNRGCDDALLWSALLPHPKFEIQNDRVYGCATSLTNFKDMRRSSEIDFKTEDFELDVVLGFFVFFNPYPGSEMTVALETLDLTTSTISKTGSALRYVCQFLVRFSLRRIKEIQKFGHYLPSTT